jgi:hypothetical protein
LTYRYLPIFPQEPELNPIEPQAVLDEVPRMETAGTLAEQAQAPGGKPEPARA